MKRKQEKIDKEAEFKMYQELDKQTEAYQNWVTKDKNDNMMYEFFYSQIDSVIIKIMLYFKKNKK